MPEKTVQKEPGKKPAPSKKPKPQQEVVVQIPLSELHPFPDHPFQVREDASMQETAESVKEYGVLVPALARPREDGGYELIAGHRRKHACELAGLATMPVIVRDIDRDAATIIMVDSNLQRENILPSERAKAYKMKMEAIKRHGARTDLTSPKISAKFRSDDEVGQDAGVSGDTIRNYIALTQLVPELQQMAQTVAYLQDHELLDYAVLSEKAAAASAHFNELSARIKVAETRMAEIAVLREHIVGYAKTRDTYVAYRKAGYSKKFLAEHESEITIHKAAKNYFDGLGFKKLPTIKALNTEYAELLAEKKAAYADYRKAREEMKELLTAKANIDRILELDKEQEEANERREKEAEQR